MPVAEPKHEPRRCPRCGVAFECRPDDVAHCQCSRVILAAEEIAYIASLYDECLCARCLGVLASESRRRQREGTRK